MDKRRRYLIRESFELTREMEVALLRFEIHLKDHPPVLLVVETD